MFRRCHIYLVLSLLVPSLTLAQSVAPKPDAKAGKPADTYNPNLGTGTIDDPIVKKVASETNLKPETIAGIIALTAQRKLGASAIARTIEIATRFRIDDAEQAIRAYYVLEHPVLGSNYDCRSLEMINGEWVCNAPSPDHPSRIPFR